jgi:hypothetical protein
VGSPTGRSKAGWMGSSAVLVFFVCIDTLPKNTPGSSSGASAWPAVGAGAMGTGSGAFRFRREEIDGASSTNSSSSSPSGVAPYEEACGLGCGGWWLCVPSYIICTVPYKYGQRDQSQVGIRQG